jgi:hypothetical protein
MVVEKKARTRAVESVLLYFSGHKCQQLLSTKARVDPLLRFNLAAQSPSIPTCLRSYPCHSASIPPLSLPPIVLEFFRVVTLFPTHLTAKFGHHLDLPILILLPLRCAHRPLG